MSFFKKLFGKSKENKSTEEIELPWINPEENLWGIKLVDLSPITHTMVSTSQNRQMAENSMSYGGEDGSTFYGIKPEGNKTIAANIKITTEKKLYPGALFMPNQMEHKWAIYFDGDYLIFVRSWLREVFVTAKVSQKDNELSVDTIYGEFTEEESPEFTQAFLRYLLISHVIGEEIPAPLPKDYEIDLGKVGYWAFSAYGNMAHYGTFDHDYAPKATKPLRSLSLLHIAVAKCDITDIENQLQQGVDINHLGADGMAPLHWAITPDTLEPMEKLLALGANPNVVNFEGATPLMNAVQSDRIDHFNLLINSKAQVNFKDHRGFTALHRASEMGRLEMVEILLQNGADKTIEAQGHTALSLARMTNEEEVISLLDC
ncbi:ankyrin repeat domain-containing protein [Flavobacterium amniphilum]|uniref:ankyrin repeat domain-containing protein n=1 Tax=Flavobacterium amniphilum TaxID=1834035 RepID=UPI002029F14F|nr:ankyrin repeat domain-containing protein [Flavobacterium amniphilum]MCL9805387.1 ankyrin repeat domain-containing protein [Flavobacterium amniphilum]